MGVIKTDSESQEERETVKEGVGVSKKNKVRESGRCTSVYIVEWKKGGEGKKERKMKGGGR